MATGRVPTTANSPLTAKGDLFTYSTAPARLAVGNNGESLVADSSATTGLRYQATQAAGKNIAINGGMDIWQRGTSGLTTATGTSNGFTADRWQLYRGAFTAGATASRQATGDTTNLPFIQYCVRVQRNSGNTATQGLSLAQNIENFNSTAFAGRTITISFYARAGANYSATSNALAAMVVSGTGTDENQANGFTGQATVISGTATLTTTWQRFTYTGTVASTATQLGITINFTPTGTAGTNDYYEITGVQLELGSVATTFTRTGGTIQGELAACQRYYVRFSPSTNYEDYASGIGSSTTNIWGTIQQPVTMRVAPTAVEYSTLGWSTGGALTAISSIALQNAGTQRTVLGLTTTGTTLGTPYRVLSNNSTSGYLALSSEL